MFTFAIICVAISCGVILGPIDAARHEVLLAAARLIGPNARCHLCNDPVNQAAVRFGRETWVCKQCRANYKRLQAQNRQLVRATVNEDPEIKFAFFQRQKLAEEEMRQDRRMRRRLE